MHCYERASQFVVQAMIHGVSAFPGLTLVHAIVLRPDGSQMGHGWVEYRDGPKVIVYEPEVDRRTRRAAYYVGAGVVYSVPYTPEQAVEHCLQSGHHGPWDARVGGAAHLVKKPRKTRRRKPTVKKK